MVEKCAALTEKALEGSAVKAAFDQQGATAFWMNPADTAAYRAADEKRLATVIKAPGAKVD
jgi:tripartite-type tricarboxylate transporter receptor subunit TctC